MKREEWISYAMELNQLIADNEWKNGAGDVEAYKVSFDPDVGNLFTKGDTGTIVFFVRFSRL